MTAATSFSRADKERLLLLLREKAARIPIWSPLAGPQRLAYDSAADIIGFGGAAGGGKTDLACGKALTQHQKVMVLRRVGTELTGIIDRFTELIGNRDGYNGQDKIWRTARKDGVPLQIEFGALPNLGDEKKFQGRPHDLLVFDEASNFLEAQVRFLLGWLRSVDKAQRCQALFTFNPPTDAEGRWIIDFFAPWLDDKHPDPAAPGELRYAAMVADPATGTSRDVWVDGPESFVLDGGKPRYDFDPADYTPQDIITPKSRTFIPSRITDNPHLLGTGYMATLQAMPEPLRSQMLYGDFKVGISDDPWQVIPTAWVDAAMARWRRPDRVPLMDSMGVDVARGGGDLDVIARRHGMWFDEPIAYPGKDGPTTAGQVFSALRDEAPIHIDVIGVGASPYDILNRRRQQVVGVNVAEAATETDRSGRIRFCNLRSQLWWKMREALEPSANTGIALPPDPKLRADLCAPTWSMTGTTLRVEGREEIVKRLGRSPDHGSAYILALMNTPKIGMVEAMGQGARTSAAGDYDPYA